MGFSLHVAWVCGWLITLGIAAPFVKADDLATFKQQQTQLADTVQTIAEVTKASRIEQLERDLVYAMSQKCHAKNPQVAALYAQRIQDIITRYEQIMKTEPRVPTCDQV